MKVWIDQDLCSGCCYCSDLCPEVFGRSEGIVVLLVANIPQPGGNITVPGQHQAKVVQAAQECPGEIIFISNEQ